MDQEFENYLNKKSDILEATCVCGQDCVAFIDRDDYYTLCKKCGKKIYFVTCSNPKCSTGFYLPESTKEIDHQTNTWKCDLCHKSNQILPNKLTKNYNRNEIPPEVIKEEKSRGMPTWILVLCIIILLIFYIIFGYYKFR